MTYTWTDDAMKSGNPCDVDKANDNLMHLKYDNVSPQDGKVPYSVNTGNVNGDGKADFINKISDTEVSFDVSPPLIITFPNGKSYILTTVNNVTGIPNTNGTDYYLIEEADISGGDTVTPKHTRSVITEDIVAPSSPNNGDYWLNIGVKPMLPYKRIDGSWVLTQFVKLGESTNSGPTPSMGTPISYAFNGFANLKQIVASNQRYNMSHYIGSSNVNCFGFYNNITGSSDTSNMPNGTNGYQITNGSERYSGLHYQSSLRVIDRLMCQLTTGQNSIYMNAHGSIFTGADAVLYVRRNF